MIKSSSKNGIKVEKDIELVMKNTGNIPWYDYLFQYVILAAICISICFCFSTGLGITLDERMTVVLLGSFVAYFMVLYSFQSVFKYSGILTFFFYVMFGYINLDRLQVGYAQVYNAFIRLYNDYFNTSAGIAAVPDSGYENGEQYFLLFMMVIVVAVVCYTGMYGRTMFGYVAVSAPIVYLSFVVGYAPSLSPYICYIVGTVALFTGTICEKYGLFSKANRTRVGQFVVHTLEKSRVRAQMVSFIILFILFGMIYFWYSPERYEKEFDAKQIQMDMQEKIREISSSDLFKDTIFDKLSSQMNIESNSGMSNGRLGRIGTIKYNNSTALTVTTERTEFNKALYLKGYVGERYTKDAWKQLSKADQEKVQEVNDNLVIGGDVELLYQQMFQYYLDGVYPYLPAEQLSMDIATVGADGSCDYIPYNSFSQYELYNGKVRTIDNTNSNYVMFDLGKQKGSQTYYEDLFQYGKFSALLQMNILNSKIIEESTGKKLGELAEADNSNSVYAVFDTSLKIPSSRVDASSDSSSGEMYSLLKMTNQFDANNMAAIMSNISKYAKDENSYFDLVKDVYTKLPNDGLEQIKELVKDRQVSYAGTKAGEQYDTMDQVDTTAYARKLYECYKDELGVDAEQLCTENFTYDELMNQDKMFEAIRYVKEYLAKNTSYTLSPGTTPDDKDYVEYFLFENKKGYCMHYASAATVMLRAMGIPSRYVEGYVVTEDDFNKATLLGDSTCKYYAGGYSKEKSEDIVEITVKDTNAHAWVEVYLPGYGWTPIEMTAPYSDGSSIEIPPVNSNPKATLKPTRKPTATPAATSNTKVTATPTSTANASGQTQVTGDTSWFSGIQRWYQGLNSTARLVIQMIFYLVLVLVLLAAVLIIRRKLIQLFYQRRLQRMDGNEKILYSYHELVRVTKKKIPMYETNMAYTEYAKTFSNSYPFVEEENASVYFSIVLKAKFGMGEITKEEEHLAMAFYRSFIKKMYEEMNRSKKLYYDYLFVIRK